MFPAIPAMIEGAGSWRGPLPRCQIAPLLLVWAACVPASRVSHTPAGECSAWDERVDPHVRVHEWCPPDGSAFRYEGWTDSRACRRRAP